MDIKLSSRAGVNIALVFFAVLVAWLLVQTGHIAARGGPKPQSTELKAYLRSPATGDKIYSDDPGVPYTSNRDTAGYPNNVIFQPSGTLYMRIQKNRRVYFDFDIGSLSCPSTCTFAPGNLEVTCHEYSQDGVSGGVFTEETPAFVKDGGTVTLTNDITFISTGAAVQYVPPAPTAPPGTLGSWVADPTLPTPTIPTMSVGDTLYVWLSISFDTTDENESFTIHHNYELWTGLSPRTGIAKVTHPLPDTWVLEPLPPGDTDHPLRALGWNQASLSMAVGRDVKAGHSGGYCDLGYWNMPFELTLKIP
jgi:hypothetical protein